MVQWNAFSGNVNFLDIRCLSLQCIWESLIKKKHYILTNNNDLILKNRICSFSQLFSGKECPFHDLISSIPMLPKIFSLNYQSQLHRKDYFFSSKYNVFFPRLQQHQLNSKTKICPWIKKIVASWFNKLIKFLTPFPLCPYIYSSLIIQITILKALRSPV